APLIVGASGLTGVQLVATPGAQLAGTLVSPAGVPLAGVLVRAAGGAQSFSTTTDSDGSYTLTGLPADTYNVTAGGAPYARRTLTGLTLGAGEVRRHVDLVLQAGGAISGTVTGPAGPVAGATVIVAGADGSGSSATTDATGAYTIDGLSAQAYTVSANADGLFATPVTGVNVAAGATAGGVKLSLGQAGSITGTVTDAGTGQPVAGIALTLQDGAASYASESDANGQFTVTELPPGTYTVATTDDAHINATVTVTVVAGQAATAALQVAAPGQVSGTVANAGQPVPAVVVYATDADGTVVADTTTDSGGHYQLTGLGGGTYRVILGDEGTPGLAQTSVTIDLAHPAPMVNFTPALAGSVAGTVFAADGVTPLPGVDVALIQNGQPLVSMLTDDQGHYVFD